MLTQERLKEVLFYDQDNGEFIWLVKSAKGIKAGTIAGTPSHGYINIGIDGGIFLAHRLAWLYMTGEWPKMIDHINHIRNDNRWLNLREVNRLINSKNRTKVKNNKSGVTGVRFDKKNKSWAAQISANGKQTYLGSYKDKFEAICARKSAEVEFGYHENHGRLSAQHKSKCQC